MPLIDRAALLADRLEILVHPVNEVPGAGFTAPRGWPEVQKLLGAEKLGRENRGRYAVLRSTHDGVSARQFLGWDGDYRAYQATFNPIRRMRTELTARGLYAAGAPVDFLGQDNFIQPSLLKESVTLEQLQAMQLQILQETITQQVAEADRVIQLLFGVPSKGRAYLAQGEFVFDAEVPSAHQLVDSMELNFLSLASRGYRGKDGNAVTIKVFPYKGLAFTVYTKTPTMVRCQTKLNYKGLRQWLSRASALPMTEAGWAEFLAAVSARAYPIFAGALPGSAALASGRDLTDFFLAMGACVGNSDSLGAENARAFLSPLIVNGGIVNAHRRFRTLVKRGRRSGLLQRAGKLWLLKPPFHRVAQVIRNAFASSLRVGK